MVRQARGEGVTLEDVQDASKLALRRLLPSGRPCFRFRDGTQHQLLTVDAALVKLSEATAALSDYQFKSFEVTLLERTKRYCASHVSFCPGDGEAINFSCPACPDRPKHRLANLVRSLCFSDGRRLPSCSY